MATPNKLQISIKLLKEATAKIMSKLSKAKKEEQEVVHEINLKKDEEKIKNIKNKLGI